MRTVFDQLYEELFGRTCTKDGEAFERLSAAVTAIVFPDADVAHNQKLRGQISQSLYQIDVLRVEAGKRSFGEAKDYTERGEDGGKVGRGDLQKLGGALPDVDADRGVFYSATDYTREAKRYASAAQGIVGRPIDLMHIRPSVARDLNGRIGKLVLRITTRTADLENAKWMPIPTPAGNATLQAMRRASVEHELRVDLRVERFVDAMGAEKVSVRDLTSTGLWDGADDDVAQGCLLLPDHFLEVENQLVEIRGLEYMIPYTIEVRTVEVVSDGEPKILVRSEDGTVNKLVTDGQLQGLEFDDSGSVKRKVV